MKYFAVKEANGRIVPVIRHGDDKKCRLKCSPLHLEKASIAFYAVESKFDTQLIGTVNLDNIKNGASFYLEISITSDEELVVEYRLPDNENIKIVFRPVRGLGRKIQFYQKIQGGAASFPPKVRRKNKVYPFKIAALCLYGLVIAGLLYFLFARIFPGIALPQLFPHH